MPVTAADRDCAESTAAAVDREVREIVERVFKRTQDILKDRQFVLERAARRLLEKETLDEKELLQLAAEAAEAEAEASRHAA